MFERTEICCKYVPIFYFDTAYTIYFIYSFQLIQRVVSLIFIIYFIFHTCLIWFLLSAPTPFLSPLTNSPSPSLPPYFSLCLHHLFYPPHTLSLTLSLTHTIACALRAISYAVTSNKAGCLKLIQSGGLKVVFPVLMGRGLPKPKKKKSKRAGKLNQF